MPALAGREAVESMKITLAEIAVDKRCLYPLLSDMRLTADEIMLVYHPFLVGPHELIHEIAVEPWRAKGVFGDHPAL